MMQLRHTLDRLRGRHDGDCETGNEKPTRKKTFPKLKFKFFSKLRRSKQKKKDEVQQAVVIPSTSSPVLESSKTEENIENQVEAAVSNINIESVERNNANISHVTINVECYDDELVATQTLTPAHSLDKLTQNRLSNFNMSSKKSLSNCSLRSFRCYDIRTVWTQTDETVSNSRSYSVQDYLTAESSEANLSGSELYVSESSIVNKSHSFGSEFGFDNGVTRKQLDNPKLAAIRNRIVACLTYPIIDSCDVSLCVDLLRYLKLPYLMALAKKLSQNESYFTEVFIDQGGLGCLLELMEQTSCKSLTSFYDVLKMLLLSECAKSLLNSTTGRDFLVNHAEHIDSLVRALDKNNVMLKMQIFDLLSALCLYSKDGYYLTLEALERSKSWQKLHSRMSLLVNELCNAELTTYGTTILSLINAIIFSNENIHARMRVRNEFISLNILETIVTLKCEDDNDLLVQCDVFEDELQADKAALIEMNSGIVNLNDPHSVFNGILNKVQGTPLCATLLGILNSLLQIDTHNTLSESQWTHIEHFTQAALANDYNKDGEASPIKEVTMQTGGLEDKEVQTDISEVPITTASPLIFELASSEVVNTSPTKPLDNSVGSSVVTTTTPVPTAPPVPSDTPISRAPPVLPIPPPPPLPSGALNIFIPTDYVESIPPPPTNPPCPPPIPGSVPPPPPGFGQPPPLPPFGRGIPAAPGGFGTVQSTEPPPKPIETPVPSKKMKSLTWMKIPAYTFKKESVWDQVLNMADQIHVEYDKLEEYFSQMDTSRATLNTLSSLPQDRNNSIIRKNSQQNLEVTLLDPKKSMNLNIFLKQFRKPNEAIIALIRAGDEKELGVEKLKGLLKQLPQQDEIDLIQGYDGEIDKLGNAESFFHELIKIPDFKLRIEIMLLKGDLNSQLGTIRPNIQVLNSLCKSLIASDSLKIFLRFVLHAGNFLNKGNNSGDAIGFRIGSLNKLVMTKSNTPKMTLLHYLVEEAKVKNKQSLKFVEELLEPLQKASRFTLEDMISEFSTLKAKVNTFKGQLLNAIDEVQSQFTSVIEKAENDTKDMDETIQCTQVLSNKLALHYCENEKTFKLNEFLEAFREFCEHVKSCEHDIDIRKKDEEKAEMRKKSQADFAEKRKSNGNPSIIRKVTEDRTAVNEKIHGKVLRRLSSRQKSNERT